MKEWHGCLCGNNLCQRSSLEVKFFGWLHLQIRKLAYRKFQIHLLSFHCRLSQTCNLELSLFQIATLVGSLPFFLLHCKTLLLVKLSNGHQFVKLSRRLFCLVYTLELGQDEGCLLIFSNILPVASNNHALAKTSWPTDALVYHRVKKS